MLGSLEILVVFSGPLLISYPLFHPHQNHRHADPNQTRKSQDGLHAPLPITKQVLSEEEFNQTQVNDRGNVVTGPNGQYFRQIGAW